MRTTSVVVMEPGSDWPGQIGDAMSVVASREGDLVRVTEEQLDALRRRKERVRVAVLACCTATGRSVAATRLYLGRILLGALRKEGHGKLLVCVSARAGYELRAELLELVGTLTEEARGTSTTVSLRFREDPGTRPRGAAHADSMQP